MAQDGRTYQIGRTRAGRIVAVAESAAGFKLSTPPPYRRRVFFNLLPWLGSWLVRLPGKSGQKADRSDNQIHSARSHGAHGSILTRRCVILKNMGRAAPLEHFPRAKSSISVLQPQNTFVILVKPSQAKASGGTVTQASKEFLEYLQGPREI